MVPIDGTPSIANALGPAGELALRTGASLDVILVEDAGAPPPSEHGAIVAPRYVDQPQHEWPAFSSELLERLLGAIARWPPGIPTRLLLGTGHPAAEILRFADQLDPDVVVLVWRGPTCGEDSVFREVVRGTSRPLLVLRC
jgi:nucleotide-binding universal stress UspA family protein